jgi:hypothetical protein
MNIFQWWVNGMTSRDNGIYELIGVLIAIAMSWTLVELIDSKYNCKYKHKKIHYILDCREKLGLKVEGDFPMKMNPQKVFYKLAKNMVNKEYYNNNNNTVLSLIEGVLYRIGNKCGCYNAVNSVWKVKVQMDVYIKPKIGELIDFYSPDLYEDKNDGFVIINF